MSTTNEANAKEQCQICGRLVAPSYMNQHHKTDVCQKALATSTPFQPNKPPALLERYSAYNLSKRDRLIQSIGIEEVRRQEREKKSKQRAIKRGDPLPNEETPIINEIKSVLTSTGLNVDKVTKTKSAPKKGSKPTNSELVTVNPIVVTKSSPQDKKVFVEQLVSAMDMKKNTAEQYVTEFFKIAHRYTGKEVDFKDLEWLKDTKKVINFIKNLKRPNRTAYADTTRRSMITALGAITSGLSPDFNEASSEYKQTAQKMTNELKKTK